MGCNLTEQVSLLIDGELPPVEARAIERHLLECAECQQVRVEFLSLRSQISAYAPTPGRDLQPRLAQILSSRGKDRAQAAGSGGLLGLVTPRRWGPAFAAVAVALLIVFAFALMLRSRSQKLQNQDRNAVIMKPVTVTPEKTEVRIPEAPSPSPVDQIGGLDKTRDRVVRKSAPKNQNTQRRQTVAIGKPSDEATRLRRERTTRSTSQPKTVEDATEDLALNGAAGSAKGETSIRSGDAQTLTAQHVEQSELLLRSFRNLRGGSRATKEDLVYDRRRAQRLFYQNVLLRREADSAGDVELASLLEHLEPILLDIANLPEGAQDSEVRVIKDRLQRQNLVALLQVNSTALTRAF